MKNIAAYSLTILAIFISNNAISGSVNASIEELIANPSRYITQAVVTEGILFLSFEGNIVCESREKMELCLYVELPGTWEEQGEKYKEFNEANVLISGVFNGKPTDPVSESKGSGRLKIQIRPDFHILREVSVIEYAKK